MIRKVTVQQLRPGMYIHDLGKSWFAHDFWQKQFLIPDQRCIDRLRLDGFREVDIDTELGLDVASVATDEHTDIVDGGMTHSAHFKLRETLEKDRAEKRNKVELEGERLRVQFLHKAAMNTVRDLMNDVRMGRQVEIERTEPMIEKIMDSVVRHPDALIPLLRLKGHDGYSFNHSISVAAMLVAVGSTLKLDSNVVMQAAQGALLQDVGKARIDDAILNKHGPLDPSEWRSMQSHVDQSLIILNESKGITSLTLEVVTQHHERLDGSGYPYGISGEALSLHAQLAAIVDAYDAMTSDRPHAVRMEPTDALRRIRQLGGKQFRQELIDAFIRTIGIYPVGSLVRLDNERLAVVVEQHPTKLLKPVVLSIYNTRTRSYITPQRLELGQRAESPAILGAESYQHWGIDSRRWIGVL